MSDDAVHRFGTAAAALLHGSHHASPSELAALVGDVLTSVGLLDAVIALADLEQRWLVPLPPSRSDPIAIDALGAGIAFRHETTTAVLNRQQTRLWAPLLDGIERLGVLGVEVNIDDPPTRWVVEHLAALVAELLMSKAQYGDDLVVRRRLRPMSLESELRWSLLPPLTSTSPRATVAANLAPAYRVAGDAFDYALNGDVLHIALFDAVGHDLHATRVANLALAAYRHSRRAGLDLTETYRAITARLRDLYGPTEFVTGQLAELDTVQGTLRWLSAGHPRPFLLRDGLHLGELFCVTSLPFGIGDAPKAIATADLRRGDGVLFFSDGVVEARRHDGALLDTGGLAEVVERSHVQRPSPAELVRLVSAAVGDHELRDDATLVLLRWTG